MQNVIETDGLTKKFRKVTAVDGLSLRVAEGEIYSFLGLNGAGKTTAIRMLLGMVKPTSGNVWVLGERIESCRKNPWDSVGYLVETANSYPELTVRENLEVLRHLRPGIQPKAIAQVIDRLDLGEYADKKAGTLSHGNGQRLGLAKALMHDPRLLILDEPANGLDPAGIVKIRNLLVELSCERGVTIFMSSHILAEVSRLAQRIGIIHQGRLLQEFDMEELEANRIRTLLVRTHNNEAASSILRNAGYSFKTTQTGIIKITDQSAIAQPEVIATILVNNGIPPDLLHIDEEDLENYFLRLIASDKGKQE